MTWLENHALAESECRLGWAYEDKVAAVLSDNGLDVEQPPKSWRADVSERRAYVNELDLWVNGLRVSVKSRRIHFTCPDDVPDNRNPLFVDTERKWGLRDPEPSAVVCISQVTDAIIWTSTHPLAKEAWGRAGAWDQTRGYSDTFLTADRSLWSPVSTLVDTLRVVWDGRWKVRTGHVTVASNRVTRQGTDSHLDALVGMPFHEVLRAATVPPVRMKWRPTT